MECFECLNAYFKGLELGSVDDENLSFDYFECFKACLWGLSVERLVQTIQDVLSWKKC